jgi:hypothetical protein
MDHFKDRGPAAGTQVPGSDTGVLVSQVVECCEVTFGEINDVDVVTDCGAVFGCVVFVILVYG